MQNVDTKTLVQCPYNITHQILKSRFQIHLGRCRKNYKNVEKVTCPFDTTHILNKVELDWHVTVCPERKSFEHYKNKEERPSSSDMPEPVVQKIVLDENWDDEEDAPTYNPQVYASKANIVRNIHGASPSVRKQFRAQERLRLLGFQK